MCEGASYLYGEFKGKGPDGPQYHWKTRRVLFSRGQVCPAGEQFIDHGGRRGDAFIPTGVCSGCPFENLNGQPLTVEQVKQILNNQEIQTNQRQPLLVRIVGRIIRK